MKRLFLILLLLTFTLTAFSQEERIIKRVELQSGISLSGYVTTQSDDTVMIETADGDVFVYSPSEIKRIVNQDNPDNRGYANYEGQNVFKKGGQICFSETGNPLTQSDFESFQEWNQYKGAQRSRNAGTIILISGLAMTAVPIINYFGWETSTLLFVTGGTLVATGLLFNILGNVQLKKIANDFNQKNGYSFDFGAQQYGIGLAMKF